MLGQLLQFGWQTVGPTKVNIAFCVCTYEFYQYLKFTETTLMY